MLPFGVETVVRDINHALLLNNYYDDECSQLFSLLQSLTWCYSLPNSSTGKKNQTHL